MRRRLGPPGLFVALGLGATAACTAPSDTGGITAQIVWPEGALRRGLRLARPPVEVARLVITALDVSGSTLAQTVLSTTANPSKGVLPLAPDGGTWTLEGVPIGSKRVLRAQAFFGTVANVDARGKLAFSGELTGIRVRFKQVTDAGLLALSKVDGVRVPRLDDQPPAPATNVVATAVAAGSALSLTFNPPEDPDVAGYMVTLTASASRPAPAPSRGQFFELGEQLGGALVVQIIDRPALFEPVLIDRLDDGRRYVLHVFAFDTDLENLPLNYAAAAPATGIPRDTAPPGAASRITVTSSTGEVATISFVGTGEDLQAGRPARYDIRASQDPMQLMNPAGFDNLLAVTPPMSIPDPGVSATFTRSFAELGVRFSEPFWVGLRAVDASGNVGPIAVGAYTVPATISVSLDALSVSRGEPGDWQTVSPPVLLTDPDAAGRPRNRVRLHGTLFGVDTGTVTLQAPGASTSGVLQVLRWNDAQIELAVSDEARGGTLTVARADGRGAATMQVAVVRVLNNELVPSRPPFAFAGRPTLPGATGVAAIYGAQGAAANGFESTMIRIVGATSEGTRYEPFQSLANLTAVAATYHQGLDRFAFVATTSAVRSLTAATVNSSTTSPQSARRPLAAETGDADGLAIELLDTTTPQAGMPALLAMSRDGSISVATTQDLIGAGFGPFTTVTTTNSMARADRLTMKRRTVGASARYLMAFRQGEPATARLGLAAANGTGSMVDPFSTVSVLSPPDVGETIRLLADPAGEFVIAYELRLADGRRDVRLLRRSQYGQGPGLAPLPATPQDRRLEDVGLVLRGGAIWIAVVSTRWDVADVVLEYTEVPLSSLTTDARSDTQPLILDRTRRTNSPAARLACTIAPSSECPIAWLGEIRPSLLFLRR